MANREACELYIEQEIDDALKEGKKPYSIGKDLSVWIEELFNTKINPTTLEKRAERQQNKSPTNVGKDSNDVTTQDNSQSEPPATKEKPQPSNSKPIAATASATAQGGKRTGAGRPTVKKFNETNDNIEWAKWTWNPVTGCKHKCKYCYARDIARRFGKTNDEKNFKPKFYPERLPAPGNTKIPKARIKEPGIKNVFVCSMADLFGDWVPDEWINQVMDSVKKNPKWNYIFLTKNPARYLNIDFPENGWFGATADTQKRFDKAIEIFKKIKKRKNAPSVKFISCEPLKENIIPAKNALKAIDWLIIGGQSQTSGQSAFQPPWKWWYGLLNQATANYCKVYFKPNLTSVPKEYPK